MALLSAEGSPYVKVGGLADVVGALPGALAELGMRVTVILPAYGAIDRDRHGVRGLREGLAVLLGSRSVPFSVLEARGPAPGVRVLLVEQAEFFGREGVYVDPETGKEYTDTAERFVFLDRKSVV